MKNKTVGKRTYLRFEIRRKHPLSKRLQGALTHKQLESLLVGSANPFMRLQNKAFAVDGQKVGTFKVRPDVHPTCLSTPRGRSYCGWFYLMQVDVPTFRRDTDEIVQAIRFAIPGIPINHLSVEEWAPIRRSKGTTARRIFSSRVLFAR